MKLGDEGQRYFWKLNRYLPIKSSSTLTRWPMRRNWRLVLVKVWGMISTANQVSLISATVKLTPFRVMEPRRTRNFFQSRSVNEKK